MGSGGGTGAGGGGGLIGALPVLANILGGSDATPPAIKSALTGIPEGKPVAATAGAPMPRYTGRKVRVPGTVIYVSNYKIDKDKESSGGGKGAPGATVTAITVKVDIAVAFGQAYYGTNGGGRAWKIGAVLANAKAVWKDAKPNQNDDRYDSISVYHGGTTQGPDSVLEGIKGTGKVPGFRDTVVVVIEDFELTDFGNSVPSTWEALVREVDDDTTPKTVSDAIEDVWSRIPDRTSAELDTTQASGANIVENGMTSKITTDGHFWGLLTEGYVSPKEILNQIAVGYDLLAKQQGSKLVFLDRGDESIVTVTAGHLGTASGKSDTGRPVALRAASEKKLPSKVDVHYYTVKSFRRGTRTIFLEGENVSHESAASVSLPLVFIKKAAKRLGRRILWRAHRDVLEARVTLPPRYVHVEETDILAVPFEGEMLYVQVHVKTTGHDFSVVCEGPVIERRNANDAILTSIPGDVTTDDTDDDDDPGDEDEETDEETDNDPEDYDKDPLEFELIAMPPIGEDDAAHYGAHGVLCMRDPDSAFKSASLWVSNTINGDYKKIKSQKFHSEAQMGYAMTALDPSDGSGAYLDRENTVKVQMLEGALTSITSAQLFTAFGKKNEIQIGDERIRFQNATALTPFETTVTATVGSLNAVTRSTGSWFTDGFAVGQFVKMSGFENEENDGVRQILAATASQLTLSGVDTMTTEGPTSNVTFEAYFTGAYELDTLVRGIADTQDHDDHDPPSAVNREPVFPIEIAGVEFWEYGIAKVGKNKAFKAVPKGVAESAVAGVVHGLPAESTRPFRPAHVHYLRDVGEFSEQTGIRWCHVTRLPDQQPDATTFHPLVGPSEQKEVYLISIYGDSLLTDLKRTQKVTYDDHDDNEVRQWYYTTSMQTDDFAAVDGEFWCTIRQKQVGTSGQYEGNVSATLHVQDKTTYMPPTGGMAAETANSTYTEKET